MCHEPRRREITGISNHRIKAVDAEQVSLTYKDYRDGATTKRISAGKAVSIDFQLTVS